MKAKEGPNQCYPHFILLTENVKLLSLAKTTKIWLYILFYWAGRKLYSFSLDTLDFIFKSPTQHQTVNA